MTGSKVSTIYKPGDRVLVTRKVEPAPMYYVPQWPREMDSTIGLTGIVIAAQPPGGADGFDTEVYRLMFNRPGQTHIQWYYSIDSLEPPYDDSIYSNG